MAKERPIYYLYSNNNNNNNSMEEEEEGDGKALSSLFWGRWWGRPWWRRGREADPIPSLPLPQCLLLLRREKQEMRGKTSLCQTVVFWHLNGRPERKSYFRKEAENRGRLGLRQRRRRRKLPFWSSRRAALLERLCPIAGHQPDSLWCPYW